MSDIVQELLDEAEACDIYRETAMAELLRQVAAEIARLRAENARLKGEAVMPSDMTEEGDK